MKPLVLIILVVVCNACSVRQTNSATRILDFKSFTIETPASWEIIEARGVDSYVGGIKIDSVDGADFDLGFYSNDLSEYIRLNKNDTTSAFVKTSRVADPTTANYNFNQNRKCKAAWDTIRGYKAKIVMPINAGFGVTGIYIDSLWTIGTSVVKFELSGNNLQPANSAKLLEAFKTLKFQRKTE